MRFRVAVLAICMLITGSLNTIATKLQDNVIIGHDEATGAPLRFRHPAFQTAAMFSGEALCLLPFALRRWYKAATRAVPLTADEAAERTQRLRGSFAAFSLPALCDAGASTLLNLGLFYTYASTFQMLRGTLVIFAGLLTITILKRSLHSHHWLGIVLIGAGAALVGASSVIYDRAGPKHTNDGTTPAAAALIAVEAAAQAAGMGSGSDGSSSAAAGSGGAMATGGWMRRLLALEGPWVNRGGGAAPNPLFGNVLVVLAQLGTATQFIIEEKYLVQYRAPVLLAVGLEGFWGLTLCCLALPALQLIPGPDGQPLDSVVQAWREVRRDWTLQWTTALTVLSIACFNFFGVSVTKNLSGAARATIDACRTLLIWLFALRVGWERFHTLQVVGFLVLLSGTSVYNEILRSCLPAAEPRHRRPRASRDTEAGLAEPLLPDEPSLAAAAAAAAGQKEGGVRFAAEPPGSRPISASRHARYTMARSVTILPGALSPHSLSSVPSGAFDGSSFAYSVPRDISRGSRLGSAAGGSTTATAGEEEGGLAYSASDLSETETGGESSREPSTHGGSGWVPAGGRRGVGGVGGGSAAGPSRGPVG